MKCSECEHNTTIALVNESGWTFAWVPACNAENPAKRRSIWDDCPEWCPLENKSKQLLTSNPDPAITELLNEQRR